MTRRSALEALEEYLCAWPAAARLQAETAARDRTAAAISAAGFRRIVVAHALAWDAWISRRVA